MNIKNIFYVFLIILIFQSCHNNAVENTKEEKKLKENWIPKLEDQVTDLANIFTPGQKSEIIKKLKKYEKDTSHQIVILTLQNLRGESIESFSLRVAKEWKIGQKYYDNGILITISIEERKMRIELGLGMEKYISNEMASKIIKNDFIPFFKKKEYFKGVENGLQSIMREANKYIIPKKPIKKTLIIS